MSQKKLFTKIIGDRIIIFFLLPVIIFVITLITPISIQKPYIDKYYDSIESTRIYLGQYIGLVLALIENKKIIEAENRAQATEEHKLAIKRLLYASA